MKITDPNIGSLLLPYASKKEISIDNGITQLVHYTTSSIAYNILNDEELWLRNTGDMNDYQEIFLGKQLLEAAIKKHDIEFNSALNSIGITSFQIKDVIDYVENHFKSIRNGVYIACLSEQKSDNNLGKLSMWRAYSNNNGVALVLNPNFLQYRPMLGPALVTSPVLYENHDLTFLEGLLNEFISNIKKIDTLSPNECEQIFMVLVYIIYISMISIKHKGFEEENEWRIIFPSTFMAPPLLTDTTVMEKKVENIHNFPQVIYKMNLKRFFKQVLQNGSAIPYLLDRIIIGPSQHPDLIAESFCELLKNKKIPNPEQYIKISDIPLRV